VALFFADGQALGNLEELGLHRIQLTSVAGGSLEAVGLHLGLRAD
jgi:hypothetical protein